MKTQRRFKLLLILILVSVIPVFADEECDQSLKEAKALYNAGKYKEAKELFVYVQQICNPTYGSANTWVQRCDEAMNGGSKPTSSSKTQQSSSTTTTLSVNKTQVNASEGSSFEFISVTSNKSWSITSYPASWCQVSKSSSGVTLTISTNASAYSRSTDIQISTNDNQKNLTIHVNQAAKTQTTTTSGSSNSSSATLSLSKTYITASATGTTEYITVTSNRSWEIQYPSAAMYSVTKLSNTSIKVVINKNTGGSRQDFFNIKTTDGSKTVKVSLSQGQGSSSSSSSGYSGSGYSSSSYRTNSSYSLPPMSRFNNSHGSFEVFWVGINGMIGTAAGAEISTLGLRWSWFGLDAIVAGVKYDFISLQPNIYYQPDVRFYIPWNDDFAVTVAVGPSISSLRNWWFTAEAGVHWHWGDAGSSSFFVRYDGDFMVGVSINASSSY